MATPNLMVTYVSERALLGTVTERASEELRLTGPSSKMLRRVMTAAKRREAPLVITGEPGLETAELARAVHAASSRCAAPIVIVDCAACAGLELDGLLFGTRFETPTGEVSRLGAFDLAGAGTLVLDDVTSLPVSTQGAVTRALQSGTFRSVGGDEPRPLLAAVISTAKRDPRLEAKAGRFRSDLYKVLCRSRLEVPPLRERVDEIEPLVLAWIDEENRRHGRSVSGLDAAALAALRGYGWPGNITELRDVLTRAMATRGDIDLIRTSDLPLSLFVASRAGDQSTDAPKADAPPYRLPDGGVDLTALERTCLEQALQRCGGNQTHAADLLRMSRFSLRHRLDKHGLLHLAHRQRGRPKGATKRAT